MSYKEAWLQAYRTDKTEAWVKVSISNGEHYFFTSKDLVDQWAWIKNTCETNGNRIDKMSLQFRSHEVHIETSEYGMYLAKAAKGYFGGDTTEFLVTGRIREDGTVHKQWWQLPELEVERAVIDPVDLCFEDMVIDYEKAKV